MAKVAIDTNGSGCWIWTGSLDAAGYGKIDIGRRSTKAHRVVYAAFVRDPGAAILMHQCDTPACVNPGHMTTGTCADNCRDRHAKGRDAIGARHGRSRITAEVASEILRKKRAGVAGRAIAAELGVTECLVSNVWRRRTWRHVA